MIKELGEGEAIEMCGGNGIARDKVEKVMSENQIKPKKDLLIEDTQQVSYDVMVADGRIKFLKNKDLY